MQILITRPREEAEETARQLALRGHQALVAPLLETRFHDGPPPALDGIQAVLATSANGVRALARRTDRRDVKVFAVGPQTSEAATAAGFAEVRNADGDAKKLAEAVAQWARPEDGVLLHVRGAEGGGLAAALRGHGFSVREDILYAVDPLPLPAEAACALKQGLLDAALFFSPRSASIFVEAVRRQDLPTARLIAACISKGAAAALEPLAFAEIRIAAATNQAALLECLG